VIVRIATEGQYELQDDDAQALEELDRRVVSACEAGNEQRFADAFSRMIEFVREKGEPVSEDRLAVSDAIIPPPDATLAEVRAEFKAEGLIPE
jgi:hypothetical protein